MHSSDNLFLMVTENRTNVRKESSLIRWKVKALWVESMWRSEDEVGNRAERRRLESRLDLNCE